eukprot:470385_1
MGNDHSQHQPENTTTKKVNAEITQTKHNQKETTQRKIRSYNIAAADCITNIHNIYIVPFSTKRQPPIAWDDFTLDTKVVTDNINAKAYLDYVSSGHVTQSVGQWWNRNKYETINTKFNIPILNHIEESARLVQQVLPPQTAQPIRVAFKHYVISLLLALIIGGTEYSNLKNYKSPLISKVSYRKGAILFRKRLSQLGFQKTKVFFKEGNSMFSPDGWFTEIKASAIKWHSLLESQMQGLGYSIVLYVPKSLTKRWYGTDITIETKTNIEIETETNAHESENNYYISQPNMRRKQKLSKGRSAAKKIAARKKAKEEEEEEQEEEDKTDKIMAILAKNTMFDGDNQGSYENVFALSTEKNVGSALLFYSFEDLENVSIALGYTGTKTRNDMSLFITDFYKRI